MQIECESILEERFVKFCTDNDIPIKRYDLPPMKFMYQGILRDYYPDFIIEFKNKSIIVEVKGVMSKRSAVKYKEFKDQIMWVTDQHLRKLGY